MGSAPGALVPCCSVPSHALWSWSLVRACGAAQATSGRDDELLDTAEASAFDYLNPLVRPLFFVAIARSVRRAARSLIRVIPPIMPMILVMCLLLLYFAMLGTRRV